MASLVTVEIDGADEFRAGLRDAPSYTEQEFTAAIEEALELLERETKELTPIGASGGAGGLRNSIGARPVEVQRNVVIGFVGTSLDYAQAVEFGTDPHYVDPEDLELWVRKKLDVPPDKVATVAFFVSRAIARFGTKPKHMFKRAFDSSEPQIRRMFNRAMSRVLDRIADI